jgi:YHS domain-containing protein
MNRIVSKAAQSLAGVLILATTVSAVLAVNLANPINKDRSSVALKGHDPVAYFTMGKPAKGSAEFSHQWMGATWHFTSSASRDQFITNPEQYAPQFGGYCSWAVSRGYTADVDPQAWKVVDGKLYLNYSKGVQQKWEGDVKGNIEKAVQNWPQLHR